MNANQLISENDLVNNIQQKVKSLMTLLSKINQPSDNHEFDQSICNDIYAYLNVIQTDFQRVINNDKFNLFLKKDYTVQNIEDSVKSSSTIRVINNNDHYTEKIQKYEDEIDFHIDEVIKSIQTTANILNTHYEEISLLDEQTNDIYQKLSPQKNILNDEIDMFNNTNVKIGNEFCKWKEKLQKKNNMNIMLTNEAHKLILKYQQKMSMVKNNIMNIVESVSISLSLRAKCLKLEICINWEGDTILKMYKNIDRLIDVNGQKLNSYNDLQVQFENINNDINKSVDYIICTSSKMKNTLQNQIQKHNHVKNIVEEKFRELCVIKNKFPVIEELLINSQEYLKNIEHKTKENEKEITIKRQQIEEENKKIKDLKNNIDNKFKQILDTQNLIEKKKLQLMDIESENERESKELENKKLQMQIKKANLKIMKSIADYYEKETEEKLQFYHNNIILPLEIKLKNTIALVDQEKTRNDQIKTSIDKLSPEFQATIENLELQIEQLDKTLNLQRGTVEKLERDFAIIQSDVLRQLDVSWAKNEQFMNVFETVMDYKMQMVNNIEIKRKNADMECELFQKRYELAKKKEKFQEEENTLTAQIDELKKSVRRHAAYNKELSKKYTEMKK